MSTEVLSCHTTATYLLTWRIVNQIVEHQIGGALPAQTDHSRESGHPRSRLEYMKPPRLCGLTQAGREGERDGRTLIAGVKLEVLMAQVDGIAAQVRPDVVEQAVVLSLGDAEGLWGEPECGCDVLFRSSWHSQTIRLGV